MSEQSTHQFVDVKEIRNGTVVLKNGNFRGVLMVSSLNFSLKSNDEKKAIINSFQNLLNSLDFTTQIIIHSRPLNLSEYFSFLKEKQGEQDNELLKIQTSEYLDFVDELIELSNIMSKFFYIVVPYDMSIVKKKGWLEKIVPGKEDKKKKKDLEMEEAVEELELRMSRIINLLSQMSLRAIPLRDRELVELYHSLYNPDTTLKQDNFEQLLATGEEEKQPE